MLFWLGFTGFPKLYYKNFILLQNQKKTNAFYY
jgi:hypothetical protein